MRVLRWVSAGSLENCKVFQIKMLHLERVGIYNSKSNTQSDPDLVKLQCQICNESRFMQKVGCPLLRLLNSVLSKQSPVRFLHVLRSSATVLEVNYSSNCKLCILPCR